MIERVAEAGSIATLGELRGVTIVTPDIDRSVAAYSTFLGYRPGPDETMAVVGAARAAAWRLPNAAECRIRHLYPESGEPRFLRFVESAAPAGYRPLTTYGWNAVELVVQDLAALHSRLLGSPFEVIGPPQVLDFDFTDQISAMQVVGPSGEVLYLTEIGAEIPGFDLPEARSFVGCPFVAVLGAPTIETATGWYRSALGREALPPFQARVEVLSRAHGMAASHRHRLTTVILPGRCLIEVDDFPPGTTSVRGLSDCGLPVGIAMASFEVAAWANPDAGGTAATDPTAHSSTTATTLPTVLRGAAGEWVELVD